jgi:hypothetical protein
MATEASLVAKEAFFRSEVDLTVSKIQTLLGYLEIITAAHVSSLNLLHVAGPSK